MGGKTKSSTKTNQTQTSAPPSWTMPGITETSGRVMDALGQVPTAHYSGPQVATADPFNIQGIQNAYVGTAGQAGNLSEWMGQQLPQLAAKYDFNTQLPTENALDINPVINAALHPLYQQLTEQVLPGIKSSALSSGAYTGDRAMSVLPGQAIQAYTDSAARTAADIGYENYNDTQNRLLQAYGLETQRGLGEEAANSNMMGSIGDYVTNMLHTSASVGDLLRMSSDLGVNFKQSQIDDALARDKYASYSPFMGLDEASQLLAALSGNWGTQTLKGQSDTTTKQVPGALDWIKAGVGVASAIAGMPGLGAGTSGLGALSASSMFTPGMGAAPMATAPVNWPTLPGMG